MAYASNCSTVSLTSQPYTSFWQMRLINMYLSCGHWIAKMKRVPGTPRLHRQRSYNSVYTLLLCLCVTMPPVNLYKLAFNSHYYSTFGVFDWPLVIGNSSPLES